MGSQAIQTLRNKTVAILGLGSLGSETALNLAQASLGKFILVDPDRLENHNSTRHAADLRFVEQLKVEAVADLIKWRNPEAQVTTVAENALTSVESWINADLVIIAGLGSEMAQQKINQILVEHQRPALYGGAYQRAIAGEVLYVSGDPEGPCYACFTSLLRETIEEPPSSQPFDYGMPPDEVKAEPGLAMHIKLFALVLADWTMRLLVDDPEVMKQPSGNLVILANELYSYGVDAQGKDVYMLPFSSRWYQARKIAGCNICDLPDDLGEEISLEDLIG